MRYLIPALLVTVVGFSTAHAAPAKTSPFSNKSLGEGGGYKHPDADVGQFFETKPAPAELKPETPRLPSKVSPSVKPAAANPSRPRPRPFAPAAAKAGAASVAAEMRNDAPAPSEPGAVAKTEAAASTPPPAAAFAAGGDDSASDDARRDYESRLFGAAPEPRRPGLEDAQVPPSAEPAQAASMGEGMLFVSLELDPQEAGALRDAVAGLGAAAAFRPDARFQPMPGASGSVRISGWLPASRLGDAISRPGVKRVEVERGSRPAGDGRVTGDYLLKVRVSDAARPEESIAASVREIAEATGFKVVRVFGFEAVPGGKTTALVSGTMPVSQLSRALGLPGVVEINSSLPSAEPSAAPAAAAAPARKGGFLDFVMTRSLWLVLLTVLLALPTVGEAVKKGLAVFVPYR